AQAVFGYEIVDGYNVGMFQRSRKMCLAGEAFLILHVHRLAHEDDLDGHLALQTLLKLPVDRAHAAHAQKFAELVLAQNLPAQAVEKHCPPPRTIAFAVSTIDHLYNLEYIHLAYF